jgi:hypothetical protein
MLKNRFDCLANASKTGVAINGPDFVNALVPVLRHGKSVQISAY